MDKTDKKSKFLKAMSMLESSGGKNLNHKTIQHGIHAGDAATGQYGLMPNTIDEMQHRAELAGEEVPEGEEAVASKLYDHIAAKTNDPVKQAHMWQHGHNIDPDKLTEDVLANSERANRFRGLQGKLGIVSPKAKQIVKKEATPEMQPESVEPDNSQPVIAAPMEPLVEPKPPMLQAALSPEPVAPEAPALPKAMISPKVAANPYDYRFKDFDTITARTDASRIRSPEELAAMSKLKGRV
jgi:hypothetical protein